MNITAMNLSQVKSVAAVEQAKLTKSHKADEVNQATSEEKKPYTSYDLTSITGPEIWELSDELFNDGLINKDEKSKLIKLALNTSGIIYHLNNILGLNNTLGSMTHAELQEKMNSEKMNLYENFVSSVSGAKYMGEDERAEEYQKLLDKVIGIFQPEYQKPLLDVMA
ncbi:hypothetical protein [Marinospirillum insulare]|uniref:DUF5610 domain-containing protein n=1 Tax=Marinospirillum insulare TaxID=217169 RepID=A0ABQ5ZXG4_9GAMM|nr:hypothetical protein [Marinospirillum insulare]GLR63983.1 hypothetical protein GCM10007878_14210 [Marinospirillum insulare]